MLQELNSPGEEQEAHNSHLCVLREGSRCPYSQRESGIREGWILRDSFCYHEHRPIRGCTQSVAVATRENLSQLERRNTSEYTHYGHRFSGREEPSAEMNDYWILILGLFSGWGKSEFLVCSSRNERTVVCAKSAEISIVYFHPILNSEENMYVYQ